MEVYVSDAKNAIYLVNHESEVLTIIAFPEEERPISDFYWGLRSDLDYHGSEAATFLRLSIECRLECDCMNEHPSSFEDLERWVEFWGSELLYCVCLNSIGSQYRMMSLRDDPKIGYETFSKVDYHPRVVKLLVEACDSLIGSWGYLMGIRQGLIEGLLGKN